TATGLGAGWPKRSCAPVMKLTTRDNDACCVLREKQRRRASVHASRITHHASAFTLAEVLAALLFLAIVIPTAVEALHIASLAGEVAARKGAAARVADRILNREPGDDELERRDAERHGH